MSISLELSTVGDSEMTIGPGWPSGEQSHFFCALSGSRSGGGAARDAASPTDDGREIAAQIEARVFVALAPSDVVGGTNGREDGNIGEGGGSKAGTQPAAKAFCPSKTVDYQKINPILDCRLKDTFSVSQDAFIKPAADRAGATVFPDVERLFCSQVEKLDRGGATSASFSGYELDEATQAD